METWKFHYSSSLGFLYFLAWAIFFLVLIIICLGRERDQADIKFLIYALQNEHIS